MFHSHHRVAGLPEEDAGIVAVIDDRIPHDFEALVPLAPRDIALFVSGWTYLDNSIAGHRIRIHFLRRDVHPANVIGMTVSNELGVVVVQPVRSEERREGKELRS